MAQSYALPSEPKVIQAHTDFLEYLLGRFTTMTASKKLAVWTRYKTALSIGCAHWHLLLLKNPSAALCSSLKTSHHKVTKIKFTSFNSFSQQILSLNTVLQILLSLPTIKANYKIFVLSCSFMPERKIFFNTNNISNNPQEKCESFLPLVV